MRRKLMPEFGVAQFVVKGAIPRTAPYKKGFRGRLYVPDDVKAWRAHIAKNFLLNGGRKPRITEQPYVEYDYAMVPNHADLDSITHSAQDGLTKDALRCDDKEWWLKVRRTATVPMNSREAVLITVNYLKKEELYG